MAYATFEQLTAVDAGITEEDMGRWRWPAERVLDRYTTGADNVRKLKVAFPTEEDAAEAVIRCEAELIRLMAQIDAVREAAQAAASAVPKTAVTAAAQDEEAAARLYGERVRFYLSSVQDRNGVNLLYGGAYSVCIATS